MHSQHVIGFRERTCRFKIQTLLRSGCRLDVMIPCSVVFLSTVDDHRFEPACRCLPQVTKPPYSSTGPARLFMLTWRSVLTCPTLNLYQKSSLLVCFFGLRHFVGSISSFLLHSILAPLFALVPEATIPNWFLIYMNLVTALYALRRHK